MKIGHRGIVLVLSAGLLLAGCRSKAPEALSVPEGAQAGELTGVHGCEYQPAGGKAYSPAECGTLVVRENWDRADSRLIALPVVRIPATGPNPEEPVFNLRGGPGGPNIAWAPPDWLLEDHDVVMVGYRGVEGTVVLSCPEADRPYAAHMGRDLFSPQARSESAAAVRECAARHRAAGIDLWGYTIPGVIEDLEAAREAMGYDRINLLGESYGTRVAQIYAYLHPDSLYRLVLIGVNTPGRFIWDPADLDQIIGHIRELCALDATCSTRTSDLAQTMYDVNRNMPGRWLFFGIDPDTVRFGTQMLFFYNSRMPLAIDAYLAAGEGDPSGLAMLNLMAQLVPAGQVVLGDQLSKGGSTDVDRYEGIETVSLGNSIMGAPLSEWVWPMAVEWPIELIPKELRELQDTDVEMLLINGTVDFSTPAAALDEARPYFQNAQLVRLPEFSHTDDVFTLQPEAFERLITSYFDTGKGDASLYVYQPLSFEPALGLTVIAKLLVAAMLLLLGLIISGVVWVARRIRRRPGSEGKMKKSLTFPLTTALLLGILLSAAGPAIAQENKGGPGGDGPPASSRAQGPTDPAELEAFLDGLLAEQMEERHIPGAAVAVVRNGEVLVAKGYGFADIENGIPVDPELTVFRIGSSGKLFTWTAVMQLVEQGKLDLNADINTYLDFRIPDTYPQPITLKHLLTHTAGFEESWYETFTLDPNEILPPVEWLSTHIPARVRPPGDSAAYSNYGTELAGYIVEHASGRPYGQYVQEEILNPLGMVHSSASGGMPADPSAQGSVGYFYADGAYEAVPDEADHSGQLAMVPAGGHVSSITDMARFMIAHLQDGRYSDANLGEVRILKEGTAPQMHGTLYAPDPHLLGTAYGLFEFTDNGQRTLGHNGETLGFRSLLLLVPEQSLGVFVVYNSETAGGLELQHLGFQRAFFDHYYPSPAVEPIQPPADFAERAGRFEGSYRLTRMAYTTFEKFLEFFGGGVMKVSDPGDGTLLWTTPWGEWSFVEVGPLHFRQVNANFSIAFRQDDQGRITHLFSDLAPMYTFERLAWYETPGFNMALLGGCGLIFLSMIAAASIGAIRNRRHRRDPSAEPRGARAAQWILLGICVLNVLFVVGLRLWVNPRPMFGVSMAAQLVLGLGVLSAVMTVGALGYTALAWKNGYWGIASRAYYTLVTVAAVAFVWFLNYWNLLGWRF